MQAGLITWSTMIDRRPRAKLFIPGIIFSLVGLRFWLDDTPAASPEKASSADEYFLMRELDG